MTSTTNTAIETLISNYPSMQPEEALSEAHYLTSAPELVTIQSLNTLSDMAVSLATVGAATQEVIEFAVRVLSNLSKVSPSSSAEQRGVTKKISDSTSLIIEANSNPTLSV